jgi:hypothetical protein
MIVVAASAVVLALSVRQWRQSQPVAPGTVAAVRPKWTVPRVAGQNRQPKAIANPQDDPFVIIADASIDRIWSCGLMNRSTTRWCSVRMISLNHLGAEATRPGRTAERRHAEFATRGPFDG